MKNFLTRKLIHFIFGFLLFLMIYFDFNVTLILTILLIIGVTLSVASRFMKVILVSWFIDKFGKKDEFPGQGMIFFIFSALIIYLVFPVNVALASIIILTIGDSISSVFGRLFGRIRIPFNEEKHIEGRLLAIILCMFIMHYLLNFQIVIAFIVSFASILIESVKFKFGKIVIDDNFILPFFSAILLTILIYLI